MNAHWLKVMPWMIAGKRWLMAGLLASTCVGSTFAAPPLDPDPVPSSVQTVILSLTGGGTAKLVITALGSGMFLLQTQDGSIFSSPPTEPPDEGTPPVPPPRPETTDLVPPIPASTDLEGATSGNTTSAESTLENTTATATIDLDESSRAEVSSTEETSVVGGTQDEPIQVEPLEVNDSVRSGKEEIDLTQSPNLLPADRPDWIAKPVDIERSKHLISVDCDAAATIEESKATLDESILREARKYVDKNVLKVDGAAEQLDRLNADWIRRHWLKKDKEFDAVLTTSSATYHQHWVQLEIDERSRRIVENWWHDIVRIERMKRMGGGLGLALGGIGVLHLLFGAVARRKT